MTKALALVSGGHFSAAALMMAKANAGYVVAVHLGMDHLHAEGYKAAQRVCDALGIRLEFSPALNYGQGWLADMLRQAGGLAARHGCDVIYTGVNAADPDTMRGLDAARAYLAERWSDSPITIASPMIATSADLPFGMALNMGHLPLLSTETHSCEKPVREAHAWGFGCGECAGCRKRMAGWEVFEDTCGLVP